MNTRSFALVILAAASTCVAGNVLACGEGVFNMGQGLRYQGYLAPRPATVLVYDDGSRDRTALYSGMKKAGHRVTVVNGADALSRALAQQHYDVVISRVDQIDSVEARTGTASGSPRLLPVVERGARNAPAVRDRFKVFVLDGASLGQYLKLINQLLQARVP